MVTIKVGMGSNATACKTDGLAADRNTGILLRETSFRKLRGLDRAMFAPDSEVPRTAGCTVQTRGTTSDFTHLAVTFPSRSNPKQDWLGDRKTARTRGDLPRPCFLQLQLAKILFFCIS